MDINEYCQSQIAEKGIFRAWPIAWRLDAKESGAAAINFRFVIHQKWHGADTGWSPEYPPGYYVENWTWIIKKGGKELNQNAIANLQKCGLWDGDFDKLQQSPPSVFVHLDIDSEEYEGKVRFRANWINPEADVPQAHGGFEPTDATLLATFRQQFGQQTRAIAGGAVKGQPPAPPPSPTPAASAPGPVSPGFQSSPAPTPGAPAAPQPPSGPSPTPSGPPVAQPPGPPTQPPGPPQQPQAGPQQVFPPPTGAPDDPLDVDDTPF